MSSGGARPRSGPRPDPLAGRRLRATDQASWTHLPAEGRQGDAPAFPLPRPTRRELELWTAEWRRPQAVVWEANHQEIEVALYVRTLRQAESPKAPVGLRKLLRDQQGTLGLTIDALAKNRWIIAASDAAPTSDQVPTGTDGRPSIRERMKVVQGGA